MTDTNYRSDYRCITTAKCAVLGDPEPESVVLSWLNPINLGSPVFTLLNVFIYTKTEGISNIKGF